MTTDEKILAQLEALNEKYSETLAAQKKSIENQLIAIEQNKANMQIYAEAARRQKYVQIIAAVIVAALVYYLLAN